MNDGQILEQIFTPLLTETHVILKENVFPPFLIETPDSTCDVYLW